MNLMNTICGIMKPAVSNSCPRPAAKTINERNTIRFRQCYQTITGERH